MPIPARRWIRRLRGGAQAQLVEGEDGNFYALKASNNPQHLRVLVNEWLCASFLKFLQLQTPEPAILELTPAFLGMYPDCSLQMGARRIPLDPGWHFGSAYPGDPSRLSIYDFVPDVLLDKVGNRREFAGMLAFDKWVSNADARQAVFFRAPIRQPMAVEAPAPPRLAFVASMIDHGYAAQGPQWEFVDTPRQGLYHRRRVYEIVRGWDDFEPWLTRIEHFPEDEVDRAMSRMPPQWIAGDESNLEALMTALMKRRGKLRSLLDEVAADKSLNLFPGWR